MHLMIDLETLSTDPRAVVLSVGAVLFDRDKVYSDFYREVEVDSQIRDGRHVMASTLAWWIDQGDNAKRVFTDTGDKRPLGIVLQELNLYVANHAPTIQVWANGASFDLPILATAYNDAQLAAPWRFYNERCYRTLKNMFPTPRRAISGTAHNARDDALAQALHLQEILQCVPQ
jgi:hypothetical protein